MAVYPGSQHTIDATAGYISGTTRRYSFGAPALTWVQLAASYTTTPCR
jgi:hypothetical protein